MTQHESGKTVQMIATMVKNMPDIEDDHRTTLVVVPAALLQQVRFLLWERHSAN